MAIFEYDWQAFLVIIIIGVALYIVNKVISYVFYRSSRLTVEQENKIKFVLSAASIIFIVYIIIEGFPSVQNIPDEYTAIITGAVSTAVAFATSEIFSNFMAGLLLFIVDPFDIGHVVKIKGHKGIVQSITLTKVVIETFNNVKIDISNSDVVSSMILNYTMDLDKIKSFYGFKREVKAPQDHGNAHLDVYLFEDEEQEEKELQELYNTVKQSKSRIIHGFTFKMHADYDGFRIKVDKIDKICVKYKETFGYKPRFHIVDFRNDITMKFRIITLDSDYLLDYQPSFAKEIYKVILGS